VKIKTLASSSEGNCTHIYTKNASILIDAGISAKKTFELSNTEAFDAIFISHEHSDHVKGLGPLGRKTGAVIYINELVYDKIKDKLDNCKINLWKPGESTQVSDLTISNFSTRHDSLHSCGFIINDGISKLGYLTDTGSWTKLMGNALKGCDGYILEADYDYKKLMEYEDYDEFLKERISSNWGHLSNEQTMELIKYLNVKNPKFICFAHLSPRTNSPDLVLDYAYKYFSEWDKDIFRIAPCKKEMEL
jgi:phosphoribosyl 1,2-cyclic phosphodiesterase